MRRQRDGRHPDLSVLAEFDNQSAMPFICEVKSSQFMNNLKQTDDKHPDFIKLCNLMKDELDRMIVVKKKVVYGLLVEGKSNTKNRINVFVCMLIILCYVHQRFQVSIVCHG